MKNLLTIFFLLNITALALNVNAELYKGLDDEGNVYYSDKPINNSKTFTPPSLTIVDAPKIKQKATAENDTKPEAQEEKTTEKFKYKTFSISSPINDETIWNQPQIIVDLAIKPSLNAAEDHTIWLLMDGKPLIKNGKNSSLSIGRADRGSHTLQAQIKDKKGKEIKSTKIITIHVKQSVIQKQPQQQ